MSGSHQRAASPDAQPGAVTGPVRAAAATRGAPATTAPSVHAAMPAMAEAARRVTGSPDIAATEAPRKASAPSVSRTARNGSPRTATNPARTSAEIGSQASSGSGARP